MRTIKYRAKIKGDAGVYPVWDLDFFNQEALVGRHSGDEYLPFKKIQAFLQYTGLEDAKRTEEYPDGQEIFEGDIIQYTGTYSELGKAQVEFKEFAWCFIQGKNINYLNSGKIKGYGLEVIGNRFENKELLK